MFVEETLKPFGSLKERDVVRQTQTESRQILAPALSTHTHVPVCFLDVIFRGLRCIMRPVSSVCTSRVVIVAAAGIHVLRALSLTIPKTARAAVCLPNQEAVSLADPFANSARGDRNKLE